VENTDTSQTNQPDNEPSMELNEHPEPRVLRVHISTVVLRINSVVSTSWAQHGSAFFVIEENIVFVDETRVRGRVARFAVQPNPVTTAPHKLSSGSIERKMKCQNGTGGIKK
jgi:hypothetical protein